MYLSCLLVFIVLSILFIGLDPQKILILFITSTIFCLLATVVTVPLIAYHRKRYFRSIGGGLAAAFAFIGG